MKTKLLTLLTMGCTLQPIVVAAHSTPGNSTLHADFSLDYVTELQTDFHRANRVNFLNLGVDLRLGSQWALQAKTISVAKTRGDRLIDDLQVFSNIEEEPLTLALSVLGLQWVSPSGNTQLFAGVRNVNEDYFATDATALFTNSSHGIFPTISANYDIANYPLASLGLDLKQRFGSDWLWQASLYNGQGYNRFTGRYNVFRFCPATDGLFAITDLKYEHNNSNYSVGLALHYGHGGAVDVAEPGAEEAVAAGTAPGNKQTRCSPWFNVEQTLGSGFTLLAQASVECGSHAWCKHYEAIGLTARYGIAHSGIVFSYAAFSPQCETDLELTTRITLSDAVYVQPALHLIRTGSDFGTVALLRLGISL